MYVQRASCMNINIYLVYSCVLAYSVGIRLYQNQLAIILSAILTDYQNQRKLI